MLEVFDYYVKAFEAGEMGSVVCCTGRDYQTYYASISGDSQLAGGKDV